MSKFTQEKFFEVMKKVYPEPFDLKPGGKYTIPKLALRGIINIVNHRYAHIYEELTESQVIRFFISAELFQDNYKDEKGDFLFQNIEKVLSEIELQEGRHRYWVEYYRNLIRSSIEDLQSINPNFRSASVIEDSIHKVKREIVAMKQFQNENNIVQSYYDIDLIKQIHGYIDFYLENRDLMYR